MATHLDLEEQEQLAQVKAFWVRWGTLITWVLTLVLAAYAGWTGWQWWQRNQAAKAGALYAELERVARAGQVDKLPTLLAELQGPYAKTVFAAQGSLLAASQLNDKGQTAPALAALQWVAERGEPAEYRDVARLRLAGLLMEQKQYDAARTALDGIQSTEFAALADDRRGDVLLAMGKPAEARAAFQKAYAAMPETIEYRQLIDAKLGALGVSAPASAASAAGGAP